MKKLLVIILVIISVDLVAQDYTYYQIAFERFISSSDAYKSQSCYRKGDFVILEEVIPFDKMSYLFQNRIDSLKKSEIVLGSSVLLYKSLSIGKKRSKMKVIFSEQKDGIFFAEATCTRKKTVGPYKDLSPFGTSVVFMFKIKSPDEVELIKVSEITNL
ncbi:MAG TPA: hypothetical protein VK508_05320 [Cyclobacteriaceae bacterium]|nr:hypothetical protein [Cyclobacteriaceae bacterium]